MEAILDAAEAALAQGPTPAVAERLSAIVLACAVQDLTGQRVSRIVRIARQGGGGATDADGLLNGPAAPGAGLDQAAVDALMSA